jgi:hypothetical protein
MLDAAQTINGNQLSLSIAIIETKNRITATTADLLTRHSLLLFTAFTSFFLIDLLLDYVFASFVCFVLPQSKREYAP